MNIRDFRLQETVSNGPNHFQFEIIQKLFACKGCEYKGFSLIRDKFQSPNHNFLK